MHSGQRRSDRFTIMMVAMIVAIPLLWPAVPPLLDLPSHMASYKVAIDLEKSLMLQRYFAFDWHVIGNLGVDLLMMPLGYVFGVEIATKIVAVAVPTLTAVSFLLIARNIHGHIPSTAYTAVPIAYNYPFLFGFVNYSLSVAISLLGYNLWIIWTSNRRPFLRIAAFAAIAVIAWLSHAIGWIILGTLISSFEVYRRVNNGQPVARALLRAVLVCLPLLAPVPLNLLSPHSGGLSVYGFFQPLSAAKWLLTLFRDRWMIFDLLSVGFVGMIFGLSMLRRLGLAIDWRLGWPAAAMFILFLIAPESINDSFFVAARIAPYAAAIALLSISTAAVNHRAAATLMIACVGFMVVRLAANTVSFWLYDRDYQRQLTALEYVPKGGAVASFAGVPCRSGFTNWYNPRTYHLSGMAVVRREAFVNATWSIPGLQLLRVHYKPAGVFASDPSEMVYIGDCENGGQLTLEKALATLPLRAFDRLWLVHVPERRWPQNPRLRKIWSSGDSVMYAIQMSPGLS